MDVGFRWKGHTYTPEHPCENEGACSAMDWANWRARAEQFYKVLQRRVGRGATKEQELVDYMRGTIDRAIEWGCSRMAAVSEDARQNCLNGIDVFIGACRFALAASQQWGKPITVGDGREYDIAFDFGGGALDVTMPSEQAHPTAEIEIPGLPTIPDLEDIPSMLGNVLKFGPVVLGMIALAYFWRKNRE